MAPEQKAYKKKLQFALLLLTIVYFHTNLYSQSSALRLYNNWNINKLYIDSSTVHTIWKPLLYQDTIIPPTKRSWLHRKFFEEHLLNVQQPNFTIYGDIIIDEYIGYDSRPIKASNGSEDNYHVPMMNTRGYEV